MVSRLGVPHLGRRYPQVSNRMALAPLAHDAEKLTRALRRAKHGSDSDVYNRKGVYDERAFEEIFSWVHSTFPR